MTVHVGTQTAVAFDEKMPKRIREDIEVKVKDNILLISSRHERTGVDPFDDVQRGKSAHIDVYLPKLLGVEATYAANISVPDSLRQSSFSVVLSGRLTSPTFASPPTASPSAQRVPRASVAG